MMFNMENGLCAIAIPGSVVILLRYVSFWSRQVGDTRGYKSNSELAVFLLDKTYLLSCFVLCCTCLMFDCVRKVVD